ncbi:hypothetical protein BASA62_000305 [Batrachochytrium salamandrivorans]|nr:hypothetical protein BASA62_000305 [Batrachochytrium salamandrivorans]
MHTPLSDIDTMVADAHSCFYSGITKTPEWREQQLRALFRFTECEEDALTAALYADLHKSPAESLIFEIGLVRNAIVDALEHMHDWMAPHAVSGCSLAFTLDRCEYRHHPLGVVLIIGTWNYPVYLSLVPLISAIAAGNAVVLKFSEVAPNTARTLLSLLPNYLDPKAIKLVCGSVPQSTRLLELHFNLIFYTGNSAVARVIMQAAARHLTPVVLELGGKSPVIVDKDTHLRAAVKRIMWAKTINAGQTCVAPDYVYIHKSIASEFYDAVPIAIKELLGDDPATSKVYPRIINQHHFDRLNKMLTAQCAIAGTDVIYGGQVDATDLYISPTVLRLSSADAVVHPAMRSEIFGPILPVIEYDDVDSVIQTIRDTSEAPLALYPFSSSSLFLEKVISGVQSGSVIANDLLISLAVERLPFGGVGESGMGTYHGKHGFEAFTTKRTVMIRPSGFEIVNDIRYQQICYDRKSTAYGILWWLLMKPLPSRLMLRVSRLFMWQSQAHQCTDNTLSSDKNVPCTDHDSRYIDSLDMVLNFKAYLSNIAEEWDPVNRVAPVGRLIQAKGTGKTRLITHIGRSIYTVYMAGTAVKGGLSPQTTYTPQPQPIQRETDVHGLQYNDFGHVGIGSLIAAHIACPNISIDAWARRVVIASIRKLCDDMEFNQRLAPSEWIEMQTQSHTSPTRRSIRGDGFWDQIHALCNQGKRKKCESDICVIEPFDPLTQVLDDLRRVLSQNRLQRGYACDALDIGIVFAFDHFDDCIPVGYISALVKALGCMPTSRHDACSVVGVLIGCDADAMEMVMTDVVKQRVCDSSVNFSNSVSNGALGGTHPLVEDDLKIYRPFWRIRAWNLFLKDSTPRVTDIMQFYKPLGWSVHDRSIQSVSQKSGSMSSLNDLDSIIVGKAKRRSAQE